MFHIKLDGGFDTIYEREKRVNMSGTPIRPICSAVGTATYQLGKFVTKVIKPAAKNSLGTDLCNTFQFVTDIRQQELDKAYMVSFYVKSLFTNIPLNKTIIKVCLDRLYRRDLNCKLSIPEKTLDKLLRLYVSDNTFLFNGKVYTQTDGVAMGNCLAPILADIYRRTAFFETGPAIQPNILQAVC